MIKQNILSLKMYCSLLLIMCVLAGCLHQTSGGQIKRSILHELKDFENLIPKSVIDEIAAKHLITDSEFRHAFKFMTSSQLPQLIQRIQQIPEVIDIFEFLHIWEDTDGDLPAVTTEKPQIFEIEEMKTNHVFIDFVLISANDDSLTTTAPLTSVPQTTFSMEKVRDFVQEVLGHLNRNNFSKMIAEKRVENPDFNIMYKALRSAEFRAKVDVALKTKNLSSIVQLLRQHGIDVNVLEPIAFEVLSWGPPAVSKHKKYKFRFFPRSCLK